jgi:fibronectin-binding autotransporter adhesin
MAYTGPFPHTNTGVTSAIIVNDKSFTGTLGNTGTVGPGNNTAAVLVEGGSTITGVISNSGIISGTADPAVTNGIEIDNSLVTGGIDNASGGKITATNIGVLVENTTGFGTSMTPAYVSNAGTITAKTGILFNASTLFGAILDSGVVSATSIGVDIGATATIENNSTKTADILVKGPSFSGGITNSGIVTGLHFPPEHGIYVDGTATFSGGILNTGTVIGGGAILVGAVSNFSGGIDNNGHVHGTSAGIWVLGDSTFAGGITNSGTVSASLVDIFVEASGSFLGGITNTGMLGADDGILISRITQVGNASVGGGIVNSAGGTISAADTGINIVNVTSFFGGITNVGTIKGVVGIDIVSTTSVSIFDSGEIVGSGGTAIEFDPGGGDPNTLTLGAGYDISGLVLGGGSDIFQLGGSGADTFNLGAIGTQYTGFATFNVVGGSWTVSGTGANWNILGGTMDLVSGTLAKTTVSSGGALDVTSGSTANSTVIASGGEEIVDSGGIVNSSVVKRGGEEVVSSGGAANNTVVHGGGVEVVYGSANSATVDSGGYEFIGAGGAADSTVLNGGYVYVASGGTLSGVIANGGGDLVAGTASGITVDSGGTEIVLSGGVAINTVVESGGVIDLLGSAQTSGLVIDAGATVKIGDGYVLSSYVVSSSVVLEVDSGATASNDTVVSGGYIYVGPGGLAEGVVADGGFVYIASGGTVDGATISAGVLDLASGAAEDSSTFTFSGRGGELVLNDAVDFSGLVAGFSSTDSIDLVDIPFVAHGRHKTKVEWTQDTPSSGTLEVSQAGHAADITILGQYMTVDFHIRSGGLGGTLVTDPPPRSAAANAALIALPHHG